MMTFRALVGNETHQWDPEAAAAAVESADAQVRAEAKAHFEQHLAQGGTVIAKPAGGAFAPTWQFDETAEEMVLMPRVFGG